MFIDPLSPIVKLCLAALEKENEREVALALCEEAWALAKTDVEKSTAAHYVARQQSTIEDKRKWNEIALLHARKVSEELSGGLLPSLNLNLGKDYEDLGDLEKAKEYYNEAFLQSKHLSDDGYGKMILSGIKAALKRMEG